MKKQLTKILSLIILAMLATSALTQQCALSSSASDLLQAGSFELTNGHSSASLSRQHKFTFNLNFQVPAGRSLQVAACNPVDIQPLLPFPFPRVLEWTSQFGEEPEHPQAPD